MPWSIDAVTIHVDNDGVSRQSIYGEHDVLDAIATTLHFFGAKSHRRSLSGHVTTQAALSSLLTKVQVDANVTLTDDTGLTATYRILSLESRRVQALGEPDKWHHVTLELINT